MIVRKWVIARAEHIDEEGVAWIAETRAGTGTWVIHDRGGDALRGLMVEFDDERSGVLLALSEEDQAKLGMSAGTMASLEATLRRNFERYEARKRGRYDVRAMARRIRDRLDQIDRCDRDILEEVAKLEVKLEDERELLDE